MRASGIRRRALVVGGGAALVAGPVHAGRFEDPETRALATYSESAMVMAVSADGATAVTLRLCRFPDAGVTWVWCHALVEGRLLAFTHHRLPASGARLHGGADAASFDTAAPFPAAIRRAGSAGAVRQVAFHADLPCHASASAPHGPGPVRVGIAGVFTPGQGLPAALADRQELIGQVECRLEAAGRKLVVAGAGKFHEQAQMRPRFVDPFSYLGFWGPDAGGMFLRTARASGGGLALSGVSRPVTAYEPERPGPLRRLRARLEDGTRVEGELAALTRFTIPIFGEAWRGSFVRGRIAGSEVVGMMNDWRPQGLAYA